MSRIRILLADDHAIMREGTRLLLDAQLDLEVVAEAADGEEAVRLAKALRPDILLLDISMPRLDGMQVARRLHGTLLGTRIIVLTGHDNEQYARALVRLGVVGYLSKTASSGELIRAVRAVHRGHEYIQPAVAQLLCPRPGTENGEKPTPRELEVLRLTAEGLKNRAIALRLQTSPRTVGFHLSNLFAKLGATSRTEMVHLARQNGWLA